MEPHQTNPFEVFEIIAHLGAKVELWRQRDHRDYFSFRPRSFLPLCTVSRTWRAALLPIMWRVYDGQEMTKVPNDVISIYSHYFRYFFHCSHLGPFRMTKLHALEVSHMDDTIIQLPNTTTVSTLVWQGAGFMHFPLVLDLSESMHPESSSEDQQEKLIQEQQGSFVAENITWTLARYEKQPSPRMNPLLSTMPTSITRLELELWIIPDELELLTFLTRFERLSTLIFFRVFEFDQFPSSSSSPSSDTTISTPKAPVLLPSVKFLRLDFIDQRSDALLEIVKCCPNLETLETVGSWVSNPDMYETLVLHPYCPKLHSLSIRLTWIGVINAYYLPKDEDLSYLIMNLTGRGGGGGPRPGMGQLGAFKGMLLAFGEQSARAIAAHAETLETLDLELECGGEFEKVTRAETLKNLRALNTQSGNEDEEIAADDGDDERTACVVQVQVESEAKVLMRHLHYALTKLTRLRTLSVFHWYSENAEDDEKHVLFTGEPWACLGTLEDLNLRTVGSDGHIKRTAEDIVVEHDRDGDGRIWVWRAEKQIQMSKEVESLIDEQVKRMPRLRRLSLCDVRYFKIRTEA